MSCCKNCCFCFKALIIKLVRKTKSLWNHDNEVLNKKVIDLSATNVDAIKFKKFDDALNATRRGGVTMDKKRTDTRRMKSNEDISVNIFKQKLKDA